MSSRKDILSLYKKILRAAERYPSRRQPHIYEAIREDFREFADLDAVDDKERLQKQLAIAYKGLSQLQQFDVANMTGGNVKSTSWEVQMEQNPMPKPADYDERKKKKQGPR